MYIILKSAYAMAKNKKVQNVFIGLIIMVIAILLFMGITMVNQTSAFETMFDRANASESLLMISTNGNDIGTSVEWWNDREEVSGTIQYQALMSNVEYELEGSTESELVMITEYQPNSDIDRMFETEDKRIDSPQNDEVFINYNYAKGRDLIIGDYLDFTYGGKKLTLVVAGFVVDPQFSNPFVTSDRCFVSENYFETNEIASDTVLLGVKYHDISEVDDDQLFEMYTENMDQSVQPIFVSYSTLEMSYNIIGNIIASTLIAVSILMFMIVIFVINTTIRNTILQQYKQIGVMKAIGYSNNQITNSMLCVYSINAFIASTIGALIGVPIRNKLNQGFGYDLQVGLDLGFDIFNFITIIVIVAIVLTVTYFASKKAIKIKPVQAIKYGMPERAMSVNKFVITKVTKAPLSLLLAIKQILINRRKAFTTTIIIALLIYVSLIIQNTGNTFEQSAYLASHLMGLEIGDSTMTIPAGDSVNEVINKIMDIDDVENAIYFEYNLSDSTLDIEGNSIFIGGQIAYGNFPEQGILLTEGRQPYDMSEIALCSDAAEITGKSTGDYITIDSENESETYLISGIYNSIIFSRSNYIQIVDEIPTEMKQGNGFYWIYSHSGNVIIEKMDEKAKIIFGADASVTQYDSNTKNIISTTEMFPAVINSLLVVFLIVCAVIILNFTMMDINHSTRTYGIMKTIGFSNGNITKILIIKTLILTSIGTVVGVVANILTANSVMQGVFSLTPFSSIELPVIFDVSGSLIIALLVLIVSVIGTLIPARKVAVVSPKQLISE
jgi:putative ABC transport system permease protein